MPNEIVVRLEVDGDRIVAAAEPRALLVDFLRDAAERTSVHAGCEHGFCGACTVLVDGVLTLSCTVLAVQVDGARIETAGSLAQDGQLSPLQEAFARHHALQCGFCTPGMLMAADDLLREVPSPTETQIRDHLSGNVCRCTGYAGIVAAVAELAAEG